MNVIDNIKLKQMFLNIITPCSRPENLFQIAESINIPKQEYRWIVIFDALEPPDKTLIPDSCEYYYHKDPESISGNAQRNFGLSKIKNGHIYFNDDDTIIHPNLWENIKDLDNHDMISFSQNSVSGELRLKGDKIENQHVDSHNFIVSRELVKDYIWNLGKYDADAYFAEACFKEAKKYLFVDKVLSIYNYLRK